MKKTVFLFRHAEPEFPEHCKGNRLNCDLTEEGERQNLANVLYVLGRLASETAERVLAVTSPLIRARRFGEVASGYGIEHRIDSEFTDLGVGQWEKRTWKEIQARWPEQFSLVEKDGMKLEIPGGEPIAEYRERILRVWRRLVVADLSHLMLIGHSATNEVILADIQGRERLNFRSQDIGCMNEIEIDETGEAHVIQENQIVYTAAQHVG